MKNETRNWSTYWNSASLVHDGDPMRQVGKTVHGQPFAEAHVNAMAREIVDALTLDVSDRVLDLGCGNGIITRRIARSCRAVTGVDFSSPLLASAMTISSGDNILYVKGDIRSLPAEALVTPHTKIYMYEVLQHLDPADLQSVLTTIRASRLQRVPIFLASVPDRTRMWAFYDTPALKAEYHRRVAEGTEAIGTWWERPVLVTLLADWGYTVRFSDLDPTLPGAHYRFHALCVPAAEPSRGVQVFSAGRSLTAAP